MIVFSEANEIPDEQNLLTGTFSHIIFEMSTFCLKNARLLPNAHMFMSNFILHNSFPLSTHSILIRFFQFQFSSPKRIL